VNREKMSKNYSRQYKTLDTTSFSVSVNKTSKTVSYLYLLSLSCDAVMKIPGKLKIIKRKLKFRTLGILTLRNEE
jgi:hypothetical protein